MRHPVFVVLLAFIDDNRGVAATEYAMLIAAMVLSFALAISGLGARLVNVITHLPL